MLHERVLWTIGLCGRGAEGLQLMRGPLGRSSTIKVNLHSFPGRSVRSGQRLTAVDWDKVDL
jgi:hypothetical protein